MPACYLETGTSGQRDIEALLNPLSAATTCELCLAAGVLWHYCQSNVPLKWQFTKLLMKCIANTLVSGWLRKLTAVFSPCSHTCQCAERIRSSFLGKLFRGSIPPVSHLVRAGGWWGQSSRKISQGCFLKRSLPTVSQPLIRPRKCSLNLKLFIVPWIKFSTLLIYPSVLLPSLGP